MSTSAQTLPPPTEITQRGPRVTLTVLRIMAVLHGLAVLAQPMLAGVYLSGDVDAIDIHGINANIAGGLGFVQLIAAIVFVWKGRGRQWAIWTSLGIVLAEQLQIGLGFEGVLSAHIPLGVAIVSMQILLTVWLFRANAQLPRPERRKS